MKNSSHPCLVGFITLQETVEDIDKNKDGKISLDEYIGMLFTYFYHCSVFSRCVSVMCKQIQCSYIPADHELLRNLQTFTFGHLA